jgi:hypothetical protein
MKTLQYGATDNTTGVDPVDASSILAAATFYKKVQNGNKNYKL